MTEQCDIGLIGLAVMGQNLILNMADHGFTVAAYNRTISKVDDFLSGPARGKSIAGCHSPEDLVQRLKRPRRVMIMVKAGKPVSQTIEQLEPHLEPGDIIIDGGNSYYTDTEQRIRELEPCQVNISGDSGKGGASK
jgi:6-phosphogluconate dehydrogenase